MHQTREVFRLKDIKNKDLIVFKGLMFLLLGILASAILIAFVPRFEIIALLAIAVWAFCRFYYFAFYVIENYVDSDHKFDGLYAVLAYIAKRKWRK